MNPASRVRARALAATATALLVVAALLPAAPAAATEVPEGTVPSIAGTITDPAGVAAAGACVALEVLLDDAWTDVDLGAVGVRTDELGAYELVGLADGRYAVSAAPCETPADTIRTWASTSGERPQSDGGVVVDGGAAAHPVDLRLRPAAITATTAPVITGDPVVGATLTAGLGVWSVAELVFRLQWARNGVAIDGAVGTEYSPSAADAGAEITVAVTADRPGWGEATVVSPAVAIALEAGLPFDVSILGSGVVGTALTAVVPDGIGTLSYRWLRDGAPVDGRVAADYELGAADVGRTISVEVTARAPGRADRTETAAAGAVLPASFATAPRPVIVGNATGGAVLTASTGAWVPTPAAFTYRWLRDGVAIPGADGASYRLVSGDLGRRISVEATATSPGYTSTTVTSAPSPSVVAGRFQAVTPKITGTAKVGQSLTAVPGAWQPTGATLSYQWKRNGAAIAGATKSSYLPVPADLGTKLTVVVTARLSGVTTASAGSAASAKVAVGSIAAPAPTISGTAAVGRTVAVVPGTWKPNAAKRFQWKRNGAAIAGATKSSYLLVPADLGTKLTVTVTGTATGYAARTTTSAASAVRAGTLTVPTPKVSGVRAVGQKLTAAAGSWKPSTTKLSYRWKRDGVAISGATKSSYTLTASDLGKAVTVTVSGSAPGYASASASAAAGAKTVAGKLSAPAPAISGTPAVGKRLTATVGTWKPAPTFGYQWFRSGAAISGATKSTYTLTAADHAATITVKVTGKRAGYTTLVKASAATKKIAAGTITTFAPKLSGTWKAGSKATVSVGATVPSGVTVKYQWYRGGAAIVGASASSYTLGNADAGKTVSVKVTATKAAYASRAVTLATGVVAARATTAGQDGMYRVGADIAPGTYYTTSASSSGCYWARLSSADGSFEAINANDFGSGRRMITILSTDRFVEFSRCGAWLRYDGTGALSGTMAGNGIAAVGTQIKAGTYVSSGNSGSACYVASLDRPTQDFDDLADNYLSYGTVYWTVRAGQFFETSGCKPFTWIGY